MYRWEIINREIKLNKYISYLEIGVENGFNFGKINAVKKLATDPDPKSAATHFMSSDDFFKQNKKKFDIVFIDGLHHADQVYRDICNSPAVELFNRIYQRAIQRHLPQVVSPLPENVESGLYWSSLVFNFSFYIYIYFIGIFHSFWKAESEYFFTIF